MEEKIFQMQKVVLKNLLLVVGCCVSMSSFAQTESLDSNRLQNIDFRIDNNKSAVIEVALLSASSIVDVSKTSDGLNIELLNTHISDDKLFVLDVLFVNYMCFVC